MKKEELLEKSLAKILEYLEKAESFTVENAPLYVKELLEYEAWRSLNLMTLGLFACLAPVIGYLLHKKRHPQCQPGDFPRELLLFLVPLGVFVFICHYDTYNKIQKAPRVFLINHLKGGC
jgi:hypothetical protein